MNGITVFCWFPELLICCLSYSLRNMFCQAVQWISHTFVGELVPYLWFSNIHFWVTFILLTQHIPTLMFVLGNAFQKSMHSGCYKTYRGFTVQKIKVKENGRIIALESLLINDFVNAESKAAEPVYFSSHFTQLHWSLIPLGTLSQLKDPILEIGNTFMCRLQHWQSVSVQCDKEGLCQSQAF